MITHCIVSFKEFDCRRRGGERSRGRRSRYPEEGEEYYAEGFDEASAICT
jgi:hypothetical protein